MRWNASDFGNIGVIRIPADQVWKPDIVLYNNADPQSSTSTLRTNAVVKSSGEVTYVFHAIFRSTCKVDLEFFPFDVQICSMKFASLTYDGFQVELSKSAERGDLEFYQEHGEFVLDDFTCVTNKRKFDCCDELSKDVTYTLRLRRRPMFYVFNLILPCILINGVSILAFYVPSESGEKVTLAVGTLLCVTVFLVIVRETMPPSQKTPLINLYYGVTVCLVASATFFSVITLNMHHKGNKSPSDVPKVLRRVVLGYLARILFVNCGNKLPKKKKTAQEVKTISKSQEYPTYREEKVEMDHIEQYHFSPRLRHRKEISSTSDISTDEFERQFLRVLNKVYETIEKNEMRIADQERRELARTEWHQVSLVCDRFLLAVFLLSTTISSLLILLSSPHGP